MVWTWNESSQQLMIGKFMLIRKRPRFPWKFTRLSDVQLRKFQQSFALAVNLSSPLATRVCNAAANSGGAHGGRRRATRLRTVVPKLAASPLAASSPPPRQLDRSHKQSARLTTIDAASSKQHQPLSWCSRVFVYSLSSGGGVVTSSTVVAGSYAERGGAGSGATCQQNSIRGPILQQ